MKLAYFNLRSRNHHHTQASPLDYIDAYILLGLGGDYGKVEEKD